MNYSARTIFSNSKIDTSSIDKTAFQNAIDFMLVKGKGTNGIGSLSEKGVHLTLKYYYVPNENFHEIKVNSHLMIADAMYDGEIYEVQSKNFYLLKKKLDEFLKEYEVTIIHPIIVSKEIKYVSPDTGEISDAKKSSKKCTIYDSITELYSIKEYLSNPKLHFIFSFLEVEEYKLLDGYGKDKKKKASKIDKIPVNLLGEFRINNIKDFKNFLPGYSNGKREKKCALPKEFTTKDVANLSGHHISYAQLLLNVLNSIGIVQKTGKSGKYILYKVK